MLNTVIRIVAGNDITKRKENNMLGKYTAKNDKDPDGNPHGGTVVGLGINIEWQKGPLGTGMARKEPNGAFVETVIDAARQRIQFYQDSKFKCRENAIAITKLEEALMWLNKRTAGRDARGVEGTHEK